MDNKMIFMNPISETVFENLVKSNSANYYRKGYADGYLVGAGVGIVTTVCMFVLTKTIFKIGVRRLLRILTRLIFRMRRNNLWIYLSIEAILMLQKIFR